MLQEDPEGELTEQNMYQNVFDADAAVIGVYGKLMNLAEPYVMLNELRADLMTTTDNADQYLRELNEHDVTKGNPYVNPRPYYEVILNCNDALAGFDRMLKDKKLSQEDYDSRYSDIAAVRCWVYLQLAIQYGKIPYVTDALSTTSDLDNVALMPRLPFDQVIDQLVRTMESLPTLSPYPEGTSLVTTVDGYTTNKFFINKRMLLGILYLWKGNYHQAAVAFKTVMESGGTGDIYTYRLTGSSIADNNDLAVGYVRYREEDENALVDNNSQGWRSIFARSEDALFDREWIWYLPFDKSFDPTDPFINLFSLYGGSYLVKPSVSAMDRWNAQIQKNDFPYDARGRKFTYREFDGKPVILKYLYNFLDESTLMPLNLFQKSGKWFLYRAASLHLYYAEAANRDRHHWLAYALLNEGLTTIPNRITNEGAPYDFDARKSTNPTIVGDWYQNAGVRGRANLYERPVTGDSTLAIEDNIIDEAALEMAYEGRRWPDLMRIAIRRNDPAFLADKIYDMLEKENNPKAASVRARLMNMENWYLPFDWE
jgi:hypothetical protein